MKISITKLVIFTSIFGMFLLAFQVLALASIAISALAFFMLFMKRDFKIDLIGIIIFVNFLYWIISGFGVGSVNLHTLTLPAFYGGDGRIFLSYFSLLFFSVAYVNYKDIDYTIKVNRWVAIISFILFLIWIPTKNHFLSEGAARNFAGFLTSHTGAGTFFGFISIFLFLMGYLSKDKLSKMHFSLAFLMLLAVFGTGSRATLAGLLVVFIWYLITNFQIKRIIILSVIAVILLALMPVVAPHTFERTFSIIDFETLDAIKEQIVIGNTGTWQPGDEERDLAGTEVNVLSRFLFWTYAIRKFFASPIIGIGWGRYNDINIQLTGTPGFIDLATIGELRYGAASAHNSYLMLLCESGLVGLFLMLWLWMLIYKRLGRAALFFSDNSQLNAFYIACQALVVFSMTAAMFGHTFASPSNCIPVLTVTGAGIAFYRTSLHHKIPKNNETKSTQNIEKLSTEHG